MTTVETASDQRHIIGINSYREIIDAWYIFRTNCRLIINDMDYNMDCFQPLGKMVFIYTFYLFLRL